MMVLILHCCCYHFALNNNKFIKIIKFYLLTYVCTISYLDTYVHTYTMLYHGLRADQKTTRVHNL